MEHPTHPDHSDLRSIASPGRGHPLEHTLGPGSGDNFALRWRATVGTQTFGQKAAMLPGICDGSAPWGAGMNNPTSALKDTLAQLKARATRLALLDPDDPDTAEYGHQAVLFWADVEALRISNAPSPIAKEVVATLRTLRSQFLQKDTPPAIFESLATALSGLPGSLPRDASAADRLAETLQQARNSTLDPLA